MSLRNRFANFFNKPKSADRPAAQSQEQPAEQEQSSGSEAVTWDSLAAERRDDGKSQITYDDLARLVRFPGSVTDTPAIVNGGGSSSDEPTPAAAEPGPLVPETPPADTPATARPAESAETQETLNSPELQAFKNFFKTDMRVKRELLDVAPKPTDDYDEASRMDYVESAYRTFRDFKHDFLGIARDFGFGEPVQKSTEDFFLRGQQDFALGDYGPGVAGNLYRKVFTDMNPEFVEEVKSGFVGYKILSSSLDSVINDASTINELLHAYHSYIMNNNHILQRIPVLDEKKARYGGSITLRGDHSALGRQVFDSLPDDLGIGRTDIVSADDHIMMMVRDRGHALTISGEPDADDPSKIWVNYNIPKICNEEMVKALPGLAGYSPNGARGSFVIPRDTFGPSLASFIAKVPTDDDMPR